MTTKLELISDIYLKTTAFTIGNIHELTMELLLAMQEQEKEWKDIKLQFSDCDEGGYSISLYGINIKKENDRIEKEKTEYARLHAVYGSTIKQIV